MVPTTEPSSVQPVRPRWKSWLRATCCVLTFFLLLEIIRITTGPNWHVVKADEIYRSAHLASDEILSVAHRFGVKTILNLRDRCPWEYWYQNETYAVQKAGLQRYDFNFSAYMPPAPVELRRFLQALEVAPRPLLIHCRRGADRTGLASTIAALYEGDAAITVDQAEAQQLTFLKGHAGVGRVEAMGEVVDLYRNWLAQHQFAHNREHLKQWIMNDYRPGKSWATIEPLNLPVHIPAGEPNLVRVRVQNISYHAWQLRAGSNVGMHLRGHIEPESAIPKPWDDPNAAKPLRRLLAAGFMNVDIASEQSIVLEVALPALHDTGRYLLYLDIVDESNQWFGKMIGSTPLKQIVEVTSAPVAQR